MSDALAIRAATLGDLDVLLAVEVRSYLDPWTPESFRGELEEPTSQTWIAFVGAEAVGHITWRTVPDGLELLNVAVTPERRQEGIGRALMARILSSARDSAAPTIFLDVRASNSAALALYRAHGFRETGRRPAYYKVGREDAVLMRLDLPAA